MYLEIYPDIIFIINFFMDLLLLFILKKVNKKESSKIKMIVAALVGATIATLFSVFIWLSPVIKFIMIYFVSSTLMVIIAFGRKKFFDLLKDIIKLYIITYTTGGFINWVYYQTKIKYHLLEYGKNLIYRGYSVNTLLLAIMVIILVITIIFKVLINVYHQPQVIYDTYLHIGEEYIKTKALMDTGNNLYDPIGGKPVIIVEYKLIKQLISEDLLKSIDMAKACMDGGDTLSNLLDTRDDHMIKIKFIPYQSIGKSKGFLIGIVLDKICIHINGEIVYKEKVIAGIYDSNLSVESEYHMLLHRELLS